MKNISEEDKEKISDFIQKVECSEFMFSIQQKPKSKKIRKSEAKRFREELSKAISQKFNNDICVILTFCSTQRNTPQTHKLVKNYMDLMHKPMSKIDTLSQIAFVDDDQVAYLHAQHFYGNDFLSEEEKKEIQPSISIRIFPMDYFNEMMSFVYRYCQKPIIQEPDFDETKLSETLQSCKGKKGFEFVDDDMIEAAKATDKMLNQWDVLDFFNISIFDIIPIWKEQENPLFAIPGDYNFFNMKIMSINIPKIPTLEGEFSVFKENLKIEIETFRDSVKNMKELQIPIAMKFVYFPPEGHSKDMDNVVLETIPKIISILRPPRMVQKDSSFAEHLVGVNEYEIIRMKPNVHCPNGSLFFLVRDAFKFKNLWDEGLDLLKNIVES